jgi:DNA mismatch endonuclease, patch repair protein
MPPRGRRRELAQLKSDRLLETAARVDIVSAEHRSKLMSRIRAKDTKPEMVVRRMLHGLGFRYRLHDRRLPGTPDLVFPVRGKILFVHGCFWHGHTCGRGFKPTTNAEYWATKIETNRRRDRRQSRELKKLGWDVREVWECETQSPKLVRLQCRLLEFLQQ